MISREMPISGGTSTQVRPLRARYSSFWSVFFHLKMRKSGFSSIVLLFFIITALPSFCLTVDKKQIMDINLLSLSCVLNEAKAKHDGAVGIKTLSMINFSCSIDPLKYSNVNIGVSLDFLNFVESLYRAGDAYNKLKNQIIDNYTMTIKQLNDANQTIKMLAVYSDVKKETVDFAERLKIDDRIIALEGTITSLYQKIVTSQIELYILSGIDVQINSFTGSDFSLVKVTNIIVNAYRTNYGYTGK